MINNLLLVILLIFLVILGNFEGFTCRDLLFTPENVFKYTSDKLTSASLIDYDTMKEYAGEPYVLKYNGPVEKPYAQCSDNVKDLNINDDSYNLDYDKQLEKELSNPLSASDIYYNENRKYPNSLPYVYKF